MDRVEVAEGALASLLFSSDNRFDSNFSDFLTVFWVGLKEFEVDLESEDETFRGGADLPGKVEIFPWKRSKGRNR